MRIVYFVKNAPIELGAIPALLTQDAMRAAGNIFASRLQARHSEEVLRDVVVCVRLKKRFFGADEVVTTFEGPPDILKKIESAGALFPE